MTRLYGHEGVDAFASHNSMPFGAGEFGVGFNPECPPSEIDDLQFARRALAVQTPALLQRYPRSAIIFADNLAARCLGAVLGEWADPTGDGDTALATARQEILDSREAQEELIIGEYGDNTMPPEAFDPLNPWDARLREVEELMFDRSVSPAPSRPLVSPYWQPSLRRAVLLEATTAPDPTARAAARDLAERRLPLSLPRLAVQTHTLISAGSGFMRKATSLTL